MYVVASGMLMLLSVTDAMYEQEMNLTMPDNVVPDTPKASVKVIGQLHSHTLDIAAFIHYFALISQT